MIEPIKAYKLKCDACRDYLLSEHGHPEFCEDWDSLSAFADGADWEVTTPDAPALCSECRWLEDDG